jgi:ribosomal protein S18 acetylase RimI-like enzyme
MSNSLTQEEFVSSDLKYCVRHAHAKDAECIFSLLNESFSHDFLQCTFFGYEGSIKWLSEELSLPSVLQYPVRLVATTAGVVIGYVDLFRTGNDLFLSYIAVNANYQNKKIGKKLFLYALRQARWQESNQVVLDVLADNEVVINWYQMLGFEKIGGSKWVIKDLVVSTDEPGKINGYAVSRASQGVYGFSRFSIHTDIGVRTVDLLGKKIFRVVDGLELDGQLIATLKRIDPQRKIIERCDLFENNFLQDNKEENVIARTIRLSAPLSGVLSRL